jgi:hypothetical protein
MARMGTTNVIVNLFTGTCQRLAVACGARWQIMTGGIPPMYRMVLGTTYYLLVQRAGNSNPFIDLTLSSVPATINEHDYCISAVPLAIGASVVANTTFAMTDETQVDKDCVPTKEESITLYRLGSPIVQSKISFPFPSSRQGSCGKATLTCMVGVNQVNQVTFASESGVTCYILVHPAAFEFAHVLDLRVVNAEPTAPAVSPVAPKAPQAPFSAPTAPVPMAPVRAPTKLPISVVPPPTKAPLVPPPPTTAVHQGFHSTTTHQETHGPVNPAPTGILTHSDNGSSCRSPDDLKVPLACFAACANGSRVFFSSL